MKSKNLFQFFTVLPKRKNNNVNVLNPMKKRAIGATFVLSANPILIETEAPIIIRLLPFNADAKPMFFSTESKDMAVAFGLTIPVQNSIETRKIESTVSVVLTFAEKTKNKMLRKRVKPPAT